MAAEWGGIWEAALLSSNGRKCRRPLSLSLDRSVKGGTSRGSGGVGIKIASGRSPSAAALADGVKYLSWCRAEIALGLFGGGLGGGDLIAESMVVEVVTFLSEEERNVEEF